MFWLIIGSMLLVAIVHTLSVGCVLGHRKIYKNKEPVRFWIVTILWLTLALICITPFFHNLYY